MVSGIPSATRLCRWCQAFHQPQGCVGRVKPRQAFHQPQGCVGRVRPRQATSGHEAATRLCRSCNSHIAVKVVWRPRQHWVLLIKRKVDILSSTPRKGVHQEQLSILIETQEVKNERFLISTRQNNVRIFGIHCLRQSDKRKNRY